MNIKAATLEHSAHHNPGTHFGLECYSKPYFTPLNQLIFSAKENSQRAKRNGPVVLHEHSSVPVHVWLFPNIKTNKKKESRV